MMKRQIAKTDDGQYLVIRHTEVEFSGSDMEKLRLEVWDRLFIQGQEIETLHREIAELERRLGYALEAQETLVEFYKQHWGTPGSVGGIVK